MTSALYVHVYVMFSVVALALSASLSPHYYDKLCPQALPAIKRVVNGAVRREHRMAASLLRLHFHDCFVHGCDASILLDQTSSIDSEKNSLPNANSARGFEVIDRIKSEVDKVCGRSIVSCADILTVAARDSVVALGGPTWKVPLGRRDSTTASRTKSNNDIPSPFMDLPALINSFKKQGLNVRDLVALSGAHTIGFSQCALFRDRIYNETKIHPAFASNRQETCPRRGGDSNLAPLDQTAASFDKKYFSNLVQRKGLLHSDQELLRGSRTAALVKIYSTNSHAFYQDFANSMIKMSNIKPLIENKGQIRLNCRRVN